jgi:hypothetical protein
LGGFSPGAGKRPEKRKSCLVCRKLLIFNVLIGLAGRFSHVRNVVGDILFVAGKTLFVVAKILFVVAKTLFVAGKILFVVAKILLAAGKTLFVVGKVLLAVEEIPFAVGKTPFVVPKILLLVPDMPGRAPPEPRREKEKRVLAQVSRGASLVPLGSS